MRTWRYSKVLLGVLSVIGAMWAVRTIFLKNHPVRFESALPLPNEIPEEADSTSSDTPPEPERKPRLLADRPRSAEVNAVLSQFSPISPLTTPEPIEPAPAAPPPAPAAPMAGAAQSPSKRPPAPEPTPEEKPPQKSSLELPISISPLEAESDEVKRTRIVFDQYLAKKGWWDRMIYLRSPGRVSSLAHRYYDEQHLMDPKTAKLIGATHFMIGNESFVQLAFLCPTRWSNTARVNFVLPNDEEALIDWESLTAYGDLPWSEFIRNRTQTTTLMRGYIAQDDYYNFEFTDRDRFVCAKLTSPDGQSSIFGYCDRHSNEGEAVSKMTSQLATMLLDGPLPISGAGPTVPVTLEIAFPPKAQTDKCVVIHRIISNRWVLTEAEQEEIDASRRTSAKTTVVEK